MTVTDKSPVASGRFHRQEALGDMDYEASRFYSRGKDVSSLCCGSSWRPSLFSHRGLARLGVFLQARVLAGPLVQLS